MNQVAARHEAYRTREEAIARRNGRLQQERFVGPYVIPLVSGRTQVMMMLFIGTYSVTTTLNVHSRGRSFVGAIDLRGLAPSVRLFRRPNTNGMK